MAPGIGLELSECLGFDGPAPLEDRTTRVELKRHTSVADRETL